MKDFTASNGITIYVRDGGTVQFQHGTRDESCGILQVLPDSEWWQTLREFFQAEADERFGRWRSKENPEWLVSIKPDEDGDHIVWNEANIAGHRYSYGASGAPDGEGHGEAFEEFKRVHTPPIWHEAKEGEVWVVNVMDLATWEGEQPMIVNQDGEFQNPTWSFPATDPDITSARKIYPAE